MLLHLLPEVISRQDVMHKVIQRLVLAVSLGYMHLALFRPDQPRQFSTDGLCGVHPLNVSLMLWFSNRRRHDPVPGLIVAFIDVLPDEDPEVIELIEGGYAADLKNIFEFL